MKINKTSGFTFIELFVVILGLFGLAFAGFLIYVAWHFISRFW